MQEEDLVRIPATSRTGQLTVPDISKGTILGHPKKNLTTVSSIRTRPPLATHEDDVTNSDEIVVARKVLRELQKNDQGLRFAPKVVSFNDCHPRSSSTQNVKIQNFTTHSQRIQVQQPTGPDAPYFTVLTRSAGRLAPGMSQEISIQFTPDEPREYKAELHVQSEMGTTVLPIVASPYKNSLQLPSRIDFGTVQLGSKVDKELILENKHALPLRIRFDFSHPHPDFRIEPMETSINCGEAASILISYSPSRLSTVFSEVLVFSEETSQPVVMSLYGNSRPQMAIEQGINDGIVAGETIRTSDEAYSTLLASAGKRNTSTENISPGKSMKRWTQIDPGVGILDKKLEESKKRQESRLFATLEYRQRIAEALANELTNVTGDPVERSEAIELMQQFMGEATKTHPTAADLAMLRAGRLNAVAKSLEGTAMMPGTTQPIDIGLDEVVNKPSTLSVASEHRGVKIPHSVQAHSQVNYVLSQKEGRALGPKDTKELVGMNRRIKGAADAGASRVRKIALADETLDNNEDIVNEKRELKASESGSFHNSKLFRDTPDLKDTAADPQLMSTIAREKVRQQKSQTRSVGPGLSVSDLAATEMAVSWLLPALNGVRPGKLQQLLTVLKTTPDESAVSTGSPLDIFLEDSGGRMGRHFDASKDSANVIETLPRQAPLPPSLEALVSATASQGGSVAKSAFLKEIEAIAKAESRRDSGSANWVGEPIVPKRTIQTVKRIRQLLRSLEMEVRDRLLRTRRVTVSVPRGGLAAEEAWQQAVAIAEGKKAIAHTSWKSSPAGMASTLSVPHLISLSSPNTLAMDALALFKAQASSAAPILSSSVLSAALLPGGNPYPMLPLDDKVPLQPVVPVGSVARDHSSSRIAFMRLQELVTRKIVGERVDRRLGRISRLQKESEATGTEDGSLISFLARRLKSARAIDRLGGKLPVEQKKRFKLGIRKDRILPMSLPTPSPEDLRDIGMQPMGALETPPIGPNGETMEPCFPQPTPTSFAFSGDTGVGPQGWDLSAPIPFSLPKDMKDLLPLPEVNANILEDSLHAPEPYIIPLANLYLNLENERTVRNLPSYTRDNALFYPSEASSFDALVPGRALAIPLKDIQDVSSRAFLSDDYSSTTAISSFLATATFPKSITKALHVPIPNETAAARRILSPLTSLRPFLTAPVDLAPALSGSIQRHLYAASAPPGSLVGHSVDSGIQITAGIGSEFIGDADPRSISLVKDVNGWVPSIGRALGNVAGLMSLRSSSTLLPRAIIGWNIREKGYARPDDTKYLQMNGSSRPISTMSNDTLSPPFTTTATFVSQSFTPTLTRPTPDLFVPLLYHHTIFTSSIHRTGRIILPTDVTPVELRKWVPLSISPSTDIWTPSQVPTLLPGPLTEDELSDDSESEDEDETIVARAGKLLEWDDAISLFSPRSNEGPDYQLPVSTGFAIANRGLQQHNTSLAIALWQH